MNALEPLLDTVHDIGKFRASSADKEREKILIQDVNWPLG